MMCFEEITNELSTIHLILENVGITFPLNDLFTKNEQGINIFNFIGVKNYENIIIGKKFIELMDIQFKDTNEFIIKNKTFETKFEG